MKNIKRLIATTVLSLSIAGGMVVIAPSAQAAHTSTWMQLAKCESGQRWHLDSGNGYYGGLQFSYSTWLAYGGGRWAPTANLAGYRQQIRIATKVMHSTDGNPSQAFSAWPGCKAKLGLNAKDKLGKPHWAWW